MMDFVCNHVNRFQYVGFQLLFDCHYFFTKCYIRLPAYLTVYRLSLILKSIIVLLDLLIFYCKII